jgi:hypothetical protein
MPTFHGGIVHLVRVVALVVLALALVTLTLSITLVLSPLCASIIALIVLALLPLLCWH